MTVSEDDVLLVRTLLASVREHRGVHEADDPDALAELLRDGDELVRRMAGELVPEAERPVAADDGDEIPL